MHLTRPSTSIVSKSGGETRLAVVATRSRLKNCRRDSSSRSRSSSNAVFQPLRREPFATVNQRQRLLPMRMRACPV